MTELLQRAIAEASKLSDEDQDAMVSDRFLTIETRVLAELRDEEAWQNQFNSTIGSAGKRGGKDLTGINNKSEK
jgi:hypothetical protein